MEDSAIRGESPSIHRTVSCPAAFDRHQPGATIGRRIRYTACRLAGSTQDMPAARQGLAAGSSLTRIASPQRGKRCTLPSGDGLDRIQGSGPFANRQPQPVESCTEECSALELADRMRHAYVGDIVVIAYRDGEAIPISLVTDLDLAIEMMARGDDRGDVMAGQIMSRGLVVVSDNDEIAVALEEMRGSGIRRLLVVVDDSRLIGIAARDDIVEYLAGLLGGVAAVATQQLIEELRLRA